MGHNVISHVRKQLGWYLVKVKAHVDQRNVYAQAAGGWSQSLKRFDDGATAEFELTPGSCRR